MALPIAVLFNDAFADWEVGFLTSSCRDFFDTDVKYFTPDAMTVTSEGGMRVLADGAFTAIDPKRFAAVVVAGSAKWNGAEAIDINALLKSTVDGGTLLGVICAGTLTAARAGLFANRKHTSNGKEWIEKALPKYAGHANYQDVPTAVIDAGVVSAPGSAPASFALTMIESLFAKHEQFPTVKQMLMNSK